MAHNIFGSKFVGAREAGWHHLGTVIPEGETITVADALKRGGIDFEYVMAPAGYQLPSGEFVVAGDKQAVLRSPTADDDAWAMLGFVGDDYRVIQNETLARGFDALAQKTGWSFETVGALGRGETVFLTLRTGKRSVFGDAYDTYIVVSDGKCANRALQITVGTVRVVCQNTLLASDNAALSKIKIAHDAVVDREYAFWTELIGQLQAGQDEYFAQLERLASVKINDKQAKAIIGAAFPLPKKSAGVKHAESIRSMASISESSRAAALGKLAQSEVDHQWHTDRANAMRAAAFTCYERLNAGDEEGSKGGSVVDPATLATIAATPYAALQGVVEIIDWGGKVNSAIATQNALFGDGSLRKERAFRAAMKLAV